MARLQNHANQDQRFLQLSIPLNCKPFLEVKKKLRDKKSRAAIDDIARSGAVLKWQLDIGANQVSRGTASDQGVPHNPGIELEVGSG